MLQFFNSIPFIEDGAESPLDTRTFPFLYNDQGLAIPSREARGRRIAPAPDRPELQRGEKYTDIRWKTREVPTASGSYEIKEFDFHAKEVYYEPLWATEETAQAFGMTLLKSGECIRFEYDRLILAQYTYGKWAGHQSPYLGPARQRELLTYNPTDLEYHDFAHVFFARYSRLPLVISVARWRPYVSEISLADLWVKPGEALVLAPKTFPKAPHERAPDSEKRLKIVDMHGNRNSALACRFNEGEDCLATETILANPELMTSELGKPHYHEEKTPTRHEPPPGYGTEL
ncbi:hypothetical protein AWM79_01200 [Pseudomonas agarici]|uniref:Uncharacterized protein n=1 Tax=Pseudomonas agarici TaxID=46677 RepID=A0A0X1SVP3_PSEAA|nr:hypothetical protein [Pseudomonas agarici]AMB83996.1 hypothetical protein AWM79_01200 [Pseudomonas agarici]NWB91473.1 hypothetical protein [Pseudomonas agarici]